MSYVGRFAPSPTGPLHAGSLATALACALDAALHVGRWHLRVEDLDPPRVVPGAADAIVDTLRAYGFHWDGDVVVQSTRGPAYARALETLEALGLVYPCGCTRREVQEATERRTADGEAVYPGTCAHGLPPGRTARAWRMRMPDREIVSEDRWAGLQRENPARETGDIVLRRADGEWAYHLAVVVDDIEAGVTDIVRGDDLLHSTARQLAIRDALGGPAVRTLHVPVVRNAHGEKLSKQTRAPAVDPHRPLDALRAAAAHLGLELDDARTVDGFWRTAPAAWEARLARRRAEF